MPLGAVDRSRVASIQRSLAVYVDAGDHDTATGHERSGLASIMQPLRELLGFDMSYAYAVEEEDESYRPSLSESSGGSDPRHVREVMGRVVSRHRRFAAFDPRRPEPWNRNAVLDFQDLVRRGISAGPVSEEAMPRLGLRMSEQLRVLVCEGSSLLAWVGGFREGPYTQRDRRVLGALVPALRRRLGIERALSASGPTRAALDAAMEAIAAPAFLLSASGAPVLANAAGKAALDADPVDLRARLSAATRAGNPSEFDVTPVVSRGAPLHFLAVARAHGDLQANVQRVARRWGLSRRQTDVLRWILDGASNARVGAELGIAEKTVETHVTAILERARVGSRSELIVASMRL